MLWPVLVCLVVCCLLVMVLVVPYPSACTHMAVPHGPEAKGNVSFTGGSVSQPVAINLQLCEFDIVDEDTGL